MHMLETVAETVKLRKKVSYLIFKEEYKVFDWVYEIKTSEKNVKCTT